MLVYRCDICKKIIEDRETSVFAGLGNSFSTNCFCADCGKPIRKFLEKNKLVEKKHKN